LCLPLSVGGKPVGILGLNAARAKRDSPEELVKRMQLVAHILAGALARKLSDQALRASQELAERMQVSLRTVSAWMRKGYVPSRPHFPDCPSIHSQSSPSLARRSTFASLRAIR
jgi:GAF domain-containing protein